MALHQKSEILSSFGAKQTRRKPARPAWAHQANVTAPKPDARASAFLIPMAQNAKFKRFWCKAH
jgi:hypothetical protein